MTRAFRRMRAIVAAGLAGCVLAVSGCGAMIAGDDAKPNGSLTYWSMWSEGEPQQKVLARAIRDFTRETGIQVDVQWVGRDNINKVSPTLNSPQSPVDLVDAAQRNVKAVMVTTHSYLPLNSLYAARITGERHTIADVIPARYTGMLEDRKNLWLVPYELVTSAFWYDSAKHPELAKNPPRTWNALVSYLDESKRAGRTPLALDSDIANFDLYYFAELAVRELGPDKLRKAAGDPTGKALRDPGIRRAAEKVAQLAHGGYFADGYASSKWPALQRKWARHQIDLIYNGTWIPSETSGYRASGFRYGAFPMPATSPGGDRSQEVSFIGFAIPKKAPNAIAAQKFVRFFMNKQRLAGIATQATNLTPRTDIAAPPELADAKRMIETAPAVHTQFDGIEDDYGDWTTKVLIPLVDSLVAGRTTAASFADELPARSAAYWSNQ